MSEIHISTQLLIKNVYAIVDLEREDLENEKIK